MQIRKCVLIEMFSLVLIGMFSPFFHIIGSRIGAFGLFPFLDGDTISLFDGDVLTCHVSLNFGGTHHSVRARMDPKDYLFLLFNDALVYAGSSPPPSPARLLYGGGCLSGQTWSNRCIKAARAHEPLHALSPRRPRRAPRRLLARALPP